MPCWKPNCCCTKTVSREKRALRRNFRVKQFRALPSVVMQRAYCSVPVVAMAAAPWIHDESVVMAVIWVDTCTVVYIAGPASYLRVVVFI